MSDPATAPNVPAMEATMETRVVPGAFRRAEAVRGVGLGLTGALSVASGVLLAALGAAVYVAASVLGQGAAPFLPDLTVMVVLAAYATVAPGAFARLSRATTADATARTLAAILIGYTAGWAALVLVLSRF
jgi:hypothetical protein